MDNPTRLYDLLEGYWHRLFDGFVAVWTEGLDIPEVAARLGADPSTATPLALKEIGWGFVDNPPDDQAGIILIGRYGTWTLTMQIQQMDIVTRRSLTALSAGGGRAISLAWHINGGHRVQYAADGTMIASQDMRYIPEALREHAEGLHIPDVDEVEDGDFPIEEMIDTNLVLVGRVTGRELDAEWLDGKHVRYIIPA